MIKQKQIIYNKTNNKVLQQKSYVYKITIVNNIFLLTKLFYYYFLNKMKITITIIFQTNQRFSYTIIFETNHTLYYNFSNKTENLQCYYF